MLWTSEAKHGNIYVKMALNYFDEKGVPKIELVVGSGS